ncbi:MAG: serine/threonine-protein kinase [Candidatus Poribacteria bacterium]|nr:serine/threonine-protein kinase [Candidatus Poribacteria bacterium]
MFRFDYLNPGSRINLPEVAACLNVQSSEFEILASHPGGMGICFQLKSLSNLETYALKCIRPDLLGDQDSFERFHEELDVWLSASVCDAVVEAIRIVRLNEFPCILATWMEGGDLTKTLSTLNPAQKFETIVRITRSLQWAQTKLGIIHRDLKPSNILFDQELLAYLSDWGLARPLQRAFVVASRGKDISIVDRKDRTQQGSFLGTVTYAAPEQIRNAALVDHRADIYALGCVMFELETGSPPFTGTSFQEIAYQHLHVSPPKLGGLFRQTTLGLENVINRCLAKEPEDRYTTYEELEQDLLVVAEKQKFALDRCVISERYKRHPLGKGHASQKQVIANAGVKGKGVVLLNLKDIEPYLEEAENLMGLGRYTEAEVLLRPGYIPNLITGSTTWHFGHSFAANYAYCLQNIKDRLDEALEIYSTLNPLQEKPDVFYVNYSQALNLAHKSLDAKRVCEQGLTYFPDDIDLLGNYTISLMDCGEIEEAQTVAMRRLAIRRDVHSIEEAAAVLRIQRDHLRNRYLPQAMSLAEKQYGLIR